MSTLRLLKWRFFFTWMTRPAFYFTWYPYCSKPSDLQDLCGTCQASFQRKWTTNFTQFFSLDLQDRQNTLKKEILMGTYLSKKSISNLYIFSWSANKAGFTLLGYHRLRADPWTAEQRICGFMCDWFSATTVGNLQQGPEPGLDWNQ